MSGTHDANFYLQVKPDRYPSGKVRSLRAVRLTQGRPTEPAGDTVLVKLSLRLPDAAFEPLAPEVIIVPEFQALRSAMEIEVLNP